MTDVPGGLEHGQACTQMLSETQEASTRAEGRPTGNDTFPRYNAACLWSLQAETVPVPASSCPMPRAASSWLPGPGMFLDAAGRFDRPSKCLATAVYYLNATSGI
jgi:hypothetical protein